ncbi:unnamed protein product [Amoebophrya sp. A120]|nr:unnamed protein product [Amoebophrya sp. A120]|eukprot:GSA120T00021982001.1
MTLLLVDWLVVGGLAGLAGHGVQVECAAHPGSCPIYENAVKQAEALVHYTRRLWYGSESRAVLHDGPDVGDLYGWTSAHFAADSVQQCDRLDRIFFAAVKTNTNTTRVTVWRNKAEVRQDRDRKIAWFTSSTTNYNTTRGVGVDEQPPSTGTTAGEIGNAKALAARFWKNFFRHGATSTALPADVDVRTGEKAKQIFHDAPFSRTCPVNMSDAEHHVADHLRDAAPTRTRRSTNRAEKNSPVPININSCAYADTVTVFETNKRTRRTTSNGVSRKRRPKTTSSALVLRAEPPHHIYSPSYPHTVRPTPPICHIHRSEEMSGRLVVSGVPQHQQKSTGVDELGQTASGWTRKGGRAANYWKSTALMPYSYIQENSSICAVMTVTIHVSQCGMMKIRRRHVFMWPDEKQFLCSTPAAVVERMPQAVCCPDIDNDQDYETAPSIIPLAVVALTAVLAAGVLFFTEPQRRATRRRSVCRQRRGAQQQVHFRPRAFLRKIWKAAQEEPATTKIQTQFRGKMARKELADRLDAKMARAAEEAKKQQESDAAIRIQSKFRGVVTRLLVLPRLRAAKQKKFQDAKEAQAARALQSCYRGKCARETVAKLREGKAELERQTQTLASVKIQSIYRGKKQRGETKLLQQQIAGARKVQEYWKSVFFVRKAFLDQRKATLQVQTHWRKMQAVKEVKEKRKELVDLVIPTTIRLQAAFRVHHVKKKFLQQKQCTAKVQSHVRKFLAGKKTEKPLALQKQLQGYFARTSEMDIGTEADRSQFCRILEEYESNEVHSVSIAEKASLFLQQWGEKIRLETDLAKALADTKNAEAVAGGNTNDKEDSGDEVTAVQQELGIGSRLLEEFATLLAKTTDFNTNVCDFQSLRIKDVEEFAAQHAAACRRYEAGNTLALALKTAFPASFIDMFQQCKSQEGDDDETTEDIISSIEKINFVQTSLRSQQPAQKEAFHEASLVALATATESADLSKEKREEAWTMLFHFVLMKANFGISELSEFLSALSVASSTCSENHIDEPAEIAEVLGKNEKLATFIDKLLFAPSESTTAKKLSPSVSPSMIQQSSAYGCARNSSSSAGEDSPRSVLRAETIDGLKQLGRMVSELRFTLTGKTKGTVSSKLQTCVNGTTQLDTAQEEKAKKQGKAGGFFAEVLALLSRLWPSSSSASDSAPISDAEAEIDEDDSARESSEDEEDTLAHQVEPSGSDIKI